MIMIVFCYGYTSFAPFSVSNFFIFYTLLLVGKSIIPHILKMNKANTSQPQLPSFHGS